ncbi:hypothetical protein BV22DRAFT_1016022 [Leucogyrophana mollusca]|uniref:Uncharacterized protein n=1 Tax=Leucogyrophana mollusca TaxID=85980 RepID=A0ACB8BE67_9AGAM|nr:hypothetical protein BV22DRAFT_1016022 [Leucogyrophana mollusca]
MHPQVIRREYNRLRLSCQVPGCLRWFRNRSGLTQHTRSVHAASHSACLSSPEAIPDHLPPQQSHSPSVRNDDNNEMDMDMSPAPAHENHTSPEAVFTGAGEHFYRTFHPYLNGRPCTADGTFLPSDAPPPPPPEKAQDDWYPYRNRVEFETAEFLFKRSHMSSAKVDAILDLWAATLAKHNDSPPFADHHDLHKVIDSTPLGGVVWESFVGRYEGERPDGDVPPWMNDEYEVWYRDPHKVVRNLLANPDFKDEMDYIPFREYDAANDQRRWKDFMSGDWVWQQADEISNDPATHGSTFVPIILGSDKTTVSVGTGDHSFYPLYASIGNVHNNVRRAHRDAVVVIGFLAIPKTNREYNDDDGFRMFRRQLFHASLSTILQSLKCAMTTPEVVRFGDNHFRRVIYGLGPYIADYEEQVVLAGIVRKWCAKCLALRTDLDSGGLPRCREHTDLLISTLRPATLWDEYGIIGDIVPFTNDFPRADIHKLLAPDLLHQIIKGTFKDHLVDWVERYLKITHGTRRAAEIMADIDRRIAIVASFSGLRRFPQGRGFKQWTGDDSKALMKVYLPAIEGHVPQDAVRAFRAFLEFCYLVRRNVITEDTLDQIQDALDRFQHYRKIFKATGVVVSFSLPRQHSMTHYRFLIQLFGAPNGLCSSITESKHIKAVKEPWRWSSKNAPLGQMLISNQRIDQLAASRVDFTARGMLAGTCLSNVLEALDTHKTSLTHVYYSEIKRARTVATLAEEINVPHLRRLIRWFLFSQLQPDDPRNPEDVPAAACPRYEGRVQVFNSAAATFYAPSDPSGIGGMRREQIRACPMWRGLYPRNDCVFISTSPDAEGMRALEVARILCFFSFKHDHETYPCAVIHWFDKVGDTADEDTGMWITRPGIREDGSRNIAIIHIDTIYRAAHLIPIYGPEFVPDNIKFYQSYDAFRTFYINKYADHHAFEIAF